MSGKKIESDIHILGGGPAGLALAYYANKNNITYSLYEKNNSVGGNCKTIRHGDFLFDTAAHRLHDKIPHITEDIKSLMNGDILDISAPSKIYYNGKMIHFPLQLMDVIKKTEYKNTIKIIKENLVNKFITSRSPRNFRQYAYQEYGKTLANLFLINYSEKLWGEKAQNMCVEISGGRLENLNLNSVLKELLFKKSNYQNHLDGSFMYPKYGFGSIFNKLYDSLPENTIQIDSDISKIEVLDNKIDHIIINGTKKVKVNKVISTLPLPLLVDKINIKIPKEISEITERMKYRMITLYVLFINKKSFTKNASIYFPQKEVLFTRIYEPKNRSKYMAPIDKTCIVIEVPSNQKIINDTNKINQLDSIKTFLISKKLINKTDVISQKIIEMPYAYPVLDVNLYKRINQVKYFFQKIQNLDIMGRSGEFEYLHVHDLFDKAKTYINTFKNIQ